MMSFIYEFKMDGDLAQFRVSGFAMHSQVLHIRDSIIAKLKELDGKPYKVMFDCRGLKALDPRTLGALKELDEYLYKSSAVKIGTVLDSILAKLQHSRVSRESLGDDKVRADLNRSRIFSNVDECLAWLKSSDTHTVSHGKTAANINL